MLKQHLHSETFRLIHRTFILRWMGEENKETIRTSVWIIYKARKTKEWNKEKKSKKNFVAQILIFSQTRELLINLRYACSNTVRDVTTSRPAEQYKSLFFSVGYLFTRESYDPSSQVLNGFAANAAQYRLQNSTNITSVHTFNGIIWDDRGKYFVNETRIQVSMSRICIPCIRFFINVFHSLPHVLNLTR
jgi:hypothetical protein